MRFFRRRWRSGPLLQDATTNNFVLGTVADADLYRLRLETPPSTQGELNALAQATSSIKASSVAAAALTAAATGAMSGVFRADSVGELDATATSSMAALGTTGQILYVGGTATSKLGITGTSAAVSITALTGGIASAPVEGDIVIAMYVVGSAGDTTLAITDGTNPYTLIDSEVFADGSSSDANLRVAYKVMGPTPDTTVTFGPTNSASWAGAMAVQVWRNVDTVNPIEAVANAVGTASSRPDGPSITPTTTGAVVVVAGGGAAPTGAVYTSSLNHFQTSLGADSIDAAAGMGAYYWGEGAYDPPAWGGGTLGAGDSWAAISLALKPVPLGLIETAMVANATGALAGALRATTECVLTASAAGAMTAKGSLAAVTYKGAQQSNLIAPGSPATVTLNGADLVGPGGSTAPAQGDLIVVTIAYGFQSDISSISIKDQETNTEYTVLDTEKYVDGSTNDTNFKVAYYIKQTATATTRVVVTAAGASTGQALMWTDLYSGIDTTSPIDLLAYASGTGTNRPTVPDLQTTREGSLLVVSAAGAAGSSTAWNNNGLTNYRDGAETSGGTNAIQAARGHKVIATDTVFAGRTWGGGATPAAGYSWAAFGYQVNGYVPDNGAMALSAAAAASASFSAASTAASSFDMYTEALADFVSEELSGAASDFIASALGAFNAAGVAVQNSVLSAAATGAASLTGIGITSSVLSGAAVGALAASGGATINASLSAAAVGSSSIVGMGFGIGVLTSNATSGSSWVARVVGFGVLTGAATGQLSGAGNAISTSVATAAALGGADFRGTAATHAVLAAAAAGVGGFQIVSTAEAALNAAALATGGYLASTLAETVLTAGGVGVFDVHGAYGGVASGGDRIIIVDAMIRKVTFGPAASRSIALDAHDRVIYVKPQARNVGGG